MKRLITTLVFIILLLTIKSQIIHENTYNHSGTYTNLAVSGNKFFLMDVGLNQCRIYNTDHSLWKTINLSVPANHYLYDIRFVSENLFTTDNSLCLVYIYYNYNTTGQYYTYTARLIRENGTELLNIPGCQYVYVHSLQGIGTKLVAYSFDYSTYPDYGIQTHVYSLPGQLPNSSDVGIALSGNHQPAYPNPATDYTTIDYAFPQGTKQGKLLISDIQGKTIKEIDLENQNGRIRILISQFPRGLYLYTLMGDNSVVNTGKFIVQ